MSDDKISEFLGLRPIDEAKREELPTIVDDEEPRVPTVSDDAIDNDETIRDIEQARNNIQNIITQGDDALKEIISIAKQSESPRAFEVTSTLMKTLLDANKEFVEMSHKKKYAKEEIMKPREAAQTNITNNNLIVSTADLLKMIKGE